MNLIMLPGTGDLLVARIVGPGASHPIQHLGLLLLRHERQIEARLAQARSEVLDITAAATAPRPIVATMGGVRYRST